MYSHNIWLYIAIYSHIWPYIAIYVGPPADRGTPTPWYGPDLLKICYDSAIGNGAAAAISNAVAAYSTTPPRWPCAQVFHPQSTPSSAGQHGSEHRK